MKQVSSVEPNVDLIKLNGKEIYLVGTAHVSKSSANLVEQVIRKYQPQTVCLELCEARYQSLRQPDRWRNTDIYRVIKDGKGYVLMAQLGLASFQKKLASEFGIKPGEEMRRAIALTQELGCETALIDRDVRITLKRAWASASLWSLTKMFFSLIVGGIFGGEELTEEDIEKLKNADALTTLTDQFAGELPGIKTALLDERDRYLAAKIAKCHGSPAVAVVGAAHAAGIKKIIGSSIDIEELERVPPPRKALIIISWAIPALIVLMIGYGFMHTGAETSLRMIVAWFLVNGTLAALGAAAALAHPLTILSAFIAAPFTSLNPTIAAGWVCGLVEAVIRKPRVSDLETIADDVSCFRGLWSNRVSKILLIMALANIGSVIGTFIGIGWIVSLL